MGLKYDVMYEIKVLSYLALIAIAVYYLLSRPRIKPIAIEIFVFVLPVAIIYLIIKNYNMMIEKTVDNWIRIKLFFERDYMKLKESSKNLIKEDENFCYYEFKNENYIVKYQRAKKDFTSHGGVIRKDRIESPYLVFSKISLNGLLNQLFEMAKGLHKELKIGSPYPFEDFVEVPALDTDSAVGGRVYDSKEEFMKSFKDSCIYYNSADENIIGIISLLFKRFSFTISQKGRTKTKRNVMNSMRGAILYERNKKDPLNGFNKKNDFIVCLGDNSKFEFGTRAGKVYLAKILYYFVYRSPFSLKQDIKHKKKNKR